MKYKAVRLLLPPEMWAQFKLKAKARNLTLTAWMTQAALAYERNAKKPEMLWWPSGWRKDVGCIDCNVLHDPKEHHPEFHEGPWSNFEREIGKVWK